MGNAPAARILVIGFGNTLRRDDGLGCLIADEVAPGTTRRYTPLRYPSSPRS